MQKFVTVEYIASEYRYFFNFKGGAGGVNVFPITYGHGDKDTIGLRCSYENGTLEVSTDEHSVTFFIGSDQSGTINMAFVNFQCDGPILTGNVSIKKQELEAANYWINSQISSMFHLK